MSFLTRQTLDSERKAHEDQMDELERRHCEQLERVRREERERGAGEVKGVRSEWRKDVEEKEKVHQEKMTVEREEGERGRREEVKKVQEIHQEVMGKFFPGYRT